MSKVLPEIHCTFNLLSMEQVTAAYASGEAVTGYVTNIDADKKVLTVKLGSGIFATLPFSEVTMYPWHYSKRVVCDLPTNIHQLLNRKIRVKVTDITGDTISVSRRINMLEVAQSLKAQDCCRMYVTQVIPKGAFGDIGDGVVGTVFINEVSKCRINHVNEFISPGQTIDVILTGLNSEQRFMASYKDACKPYCPSDYKIGQTINCTVSNWIAVGSISKYYASISPQVTGIITIKGHKYLDYGIKVQCAISAITEKGLRLDFLRTL